MYRAMPTELIQEGADHREEYITDSLKLEQFSMNHACDGLFPEYLRTDGEGLKILGKYITLPFAQEFSIEIILKKPAFNSIQSVSLKKLAKATIKEFSINTMRKESKLVLSTH